MQCWGKGCRWQCQQWTQSSWMGSGLGAALLCHAHRVGVAQQPDGRTMGAAVGSAVLLCPTWAKRAQKERQSH